MGLVKVLKQIIGEEIGWADRTIQQAGAESQAWWDALHARSEEDIDADDVKAMKRFLDSAKEDAEAVNDYHTAKRYRAAMSKIDEVVDDNGKPRKRFFFF